MKRRSKAKEQINYSAEFFEALKLLEKEKGIPADYLLEKIRAAIVIAVKRDHGGTDENISVILNPETAEFAVSMSRVVAEEITDPDTEMTKEQAARYNAAALPGDTVHIPLETHEFGRIAAQTAKHVIRQGIREAERGQQLQEFQRYNQDLVTALINRIDPMTGNATLEIGKNHAVLPKSEQMPGEELREGQRVKVYVASVSEGDRGPRVLISRTHRDLVKRLFELEVPEIFNGVVEIKSISREAASRTKMAVLSHDENVDAVGACIGPRGARVADIVEELGGEKIDIVEYDEDPATFIAAALSPAKVVSVELDPDGAKACRVIVPDNQLSLAIGNKGQNARLAVHLTGWKIDIRPESAPDAE
ncbi:MAG: transcription termination/antitermination protein NusA [Clostridia bacterium]|nr:transcription termination/antitermination protein NusA [Clostridia bacterium]